jgi:IclR family acetate operon transcriptional repressor
MATFEPPQSTEVSRALGRAMGLLLLAAEQGRVSIIDAQRLLGIPGSSAHRLLHTLAGAGFLEHALPRGFRLGPALIDLGLAAAERMNVRTAAGAFLLSLGQELAETVTLHALRGNNEVGLDSVESSRTIRVASRAGVSLPANATAAGKVLLAALAFEEVRRRFPIKLPRTSEGSITSWNQLDDELTEVRERGWASDLEESEAELHAVAVPVADPRGRVVAALSIAAPRSRLHPSQMAGKAAVLSSAATGITAALADLR